MPGRETEESRETTLEVAPETEGAAPAMSRGLVQEEPERRKVACQPSWRAVAAEWEHQGVLVEDEGRRAWGRATYEWTRSTGCRQMAIEGRLGCLGCVRHGDVGHDCCQKDPGLRPADEDGEEWQSWVPAWWGAACWSGWRGGQKVRLRTVPC